MSRYTGAQCRLCRREGMKLFLKGEKCLTPKCIFEHRDYPPGMHNWRRGKVSDFGLQLREKQKVKRYYGLLEKQFRRFFDEATRTTGNTGENLLVMLESRLDNVLRRLNWAYSATDARQMILHGHVKVNGRKVDRPAYLVEAGDIITLKDSEKSRNMVQVRLGRANKTDVPSWLASDESKLEASVTSRPVRDEIPVEIQEQLVVEFCSR